eukprot:SAG31_NODE_1125_length_9770_cov_2.732499_8_plen_542_part_00
MAYGQPDANRQRLPIVLGTVLVATALCAIAGHHQLHVVSTTFSVSKAKAGSASDNIELLNTGLITPWQLSKAARMRGHSKDSQLSERSSKIFEESTNLFNEINEAASPGQLRVSLGLTEKSTGASPGPCVDDESCQLNGICQPDKTCLCSKGWKGPACGQLDLLPTPAGRRNDAAFPHPTQKGTSTWGGRAVWDEKTRLWHGYFAEMAGHCGMNVWQTGSICRHAVAKRPEGPYEPLDQGTIGTDCHNPSIIRAPNGSLLLFYIGGGQPIGSPGGTLGAAGEALPECHGGRTPAIQRQPSGGQARTGPVPAYWVSDGVDKPWRAGPVAPVQHPSGRIQGTMFNNPAPYIFPNGSMMVSYVVRCGKGSAKGCVNSHGIAWTDHWASGRWRPMVGNDFALKLFPPQSGGRAEDGFIWVDNEGYCHALVHDQGMSYGKSGETGSVGHAYSTDCRSWKYSSQPAASTTIEHTDGTSTTWIKRERPHLMFSDDGTPTFLMTGVMAIDVAQPTRGFEHCTWANHLRTDAGGKGLCDPGFTHVQAIRP